MKQLMRFELKKIFMKRIVRMAVLGLLILNILFVFSDYYSMYVYQKEKSWVNRQSDVDSKEMCGCREKSISECG